MKKKKCFCGLLFVLICVLSLYACKDKKSPSQSTSGDTAKPKGGDEVLATKIEKLDRGTLPYIEKLDASGLLEYRRKTGITVCGISPIALLLETLKQSGKDVGVKVLDYYTSGHVTGDWENTVSYFTIAFYEKGEGGEKGKTRTVKKTQDTPPGAGSEKHTDSDQPAEDGDGRVRTNTPEGKERVRPMATGPGWFPKKEGPLRRELKSLLAKGERAAIPGRLLGLITPHAGYRFSGKGAATGFRLMDSETERVVVMGVPHRVRVKGISIGPFDKYATPLGPAAVDSRVVRMLSDYPLFGSIARAHMQEHSIEVQLPFIRYRSPSARIIPLLVGRMSLEDYAKAASRLVPLLEDKTVFVASSDFAHRGPRFGYEPFKVQ